MPGRLGLSGLDSRGLPDRPFVRELFRGLAPRYNRLLVAYSLAQDLRWKNVLVRRLRPRPGERALDLACGTGLILDRLARIVGESRVVGADINRSMLLRVVDPRASHLLLQADAEELPLVSESFDLVTAGYLLKYVRLDRFFFEVGRVLRPGGRFGGYDFSRPVRGTRLGTLYSIYLHQILPSIGRVRGPARAHLRELFEFLSQVVEASGWESRVVDALSAAGFVEAEVVPSLGGAISWVWARKRVS